MNVEIKVMDSGHIRVRPLSADRARGYSEVYRKWKKGGKGDPSLYLEFDIQLFYLGVSPDEIDTVEGGRPIRKVVPVNKFNKLFEIYIKRQARTPSRRLKKQRGR